MSFSSWDAFNSRKEIKKNVLFRWINEDKFDEEQEKIYFESGPHICTSTGLVHISSPDTKYERPKHIRLKCCEHCGASTNKGEKCQYCGSYYRDVI